MKQGPYICEYVDLQGVSQETFTQIPLAEGGHVPVQIPDRWNWFLATRRLWILPTARRKKDTGTQENCQSWTWISRFL